ncbi:MAG: hypothetical protein M3355_05655, partial [Actinomycetota bacterium]|nr:hypothetical protein [Actinomycetota bacterium]
MEKEEEEAGGGRRGGQRERRKPRTHSRLTERDRAIAGWIERVGVAGVDHVALRFGMTRRVAWRRLGALRESGWVRSWRPFAEAGVCYPTGLRRPHVGQLH